MGSSFSRVQIRKLTDGDSLYGITEGTAGANKAVVLDSNKDFTGIRNLTLTGTLSAATIGTSGIGGRQIAKTSAAVTKNASAAYADITGLTGFTLVAGATYKFKAFLPSTVASGTGGIKYCFNYTTATLTSIEATGIGNTASAVATQHTTTTTTQTDLFTQAAVVIATVIEGTMVVNAGGTMAVQVAQNTSNGSDTVALVGGTFELLRIA